MKLLILLIFLFNYILGLRLPEGNSTFFYYLYLIATVANKELSNSAARKERNSQITKPPYKIERCDQIVALPGKRLPRINDFATRVEAFFDIGMYIINMYEKNDAANLIQSIDTQQLEAVPEVIKGTATCLYIADKKSNLRKSFAMCLNDKETVINIQEVIGNFLYNCGAQKMKTECQEISVFALNEDGSKNLEIMNLF